MRSCCRCTGNLGVPDVLFIACIAGRNVVIHCECACHTGRLAKKVHDGGPGQQP